ncbi:MAG: hypothetical protein OEU26_00025 [Candidatus Tectomicrobia bacterium]|nr:hypothetical protein [Candidatus Tectomicrobia bacterium]
MAKPWLDQYPGDKKSFDLMTTILMGLAFMLVVIMLINLVSGQTLSGYLFFWLFLDLFVLLIVVVTKHSRRSRFQICPHCHHNAPKGYSVCSGCGYRAQEEVKL